MKRNLFLIFLAIFTSGCSNIQIYWNEEPLLVESAVVVNAAMATKDTVALITGKIKVGDEIKTVVFFEFRPNQKLKTFIEKIKPGDKIYIRYRMVFQLDIGINSFSSFTSITGPNGQYQYN